MWKISSATIPSVFDISIFSSTPERSGDGSFLSFLDLYSIYRKSQAPENGGGMEVSHRSSICIRHIGICKHPRKKWGWKFPIVSRSVFDISKIQAPQKEAGRAPLPPFFASSLPRFLAPSLPHFLASSFPRFLLLAILFPLSRHSRAASDSICFPCVFDMLNLTARI